MDGLGADLTKFLRELAVVEGGGKVATGLEVVAHRIEELEAENERLRENQKLLIKALRDLRDEQNGPPRPWDQEGWELAMHVSGALLEALEAGDE
jgi:hypothetical protein